MSQPVVLVLDSVTSARRRVASLIETCLAETRPVTAPSVEAALRLLKGRIPSAAVVGVSQTGKKSLNSVKSLREHFFDDPFPVLLLLANGVNLEASDQQYLETGDQVMSADLPDVILADRLKAILQLREQTEELRTANKRLATLASERSVALRESEERYRTIFNTTGDLVVAFEISRKDLVPGRIIEVNDETCRVLGYDAENLLGMSIMDLVHPERAEAAVVRMESLVKHQQVFFETVLVSKTGQTLPIELTVRSLASKDRFVALAIARPPHSRIEAVRTSPDGSSSYEIVADRTGQILYDYHIETGGIRWIGPISRVTGYTREEVEGVDFQRLLSLIHPEDRDRVNASIRTAVANVGAYHAEYRFLHKSGAYRYFEDEGLALPGENGRAYRVLGALRDITARTLAERQRRRFELEAQHSQRLESLGVLAGGIAHDFNNILAAIIGLTDMALQDLHPDSETHSDLSEALQAAHRAKDLVKQILAFSRQGSEERIPLYLHVIVREAMKLARATLPATIEIMDNVDVHSGVVAANAAQMHQVIMNFITNSAQAMRDQGGRIIVTLQDVDVDERLAATHPKLHPGPYVRLSVSDTGHGMAPDILKRVFDPFFTTKGPGEGTGMGLSVVHGIVTSHGGAVMAESAPGHGATFNTYLPRVVSTVLESERPCKATSRGQGRILFVDDEDAVRRFGKAALERLGYEVVAAESASRALEQFQSDESGFDLLITDQVMPKMSGDELVMELRRLGSDIPVILFTGYGENLTEQKAARAGIQEIVTKPVVMHELDAIIRRVLFTRSRALPSRTPVPPEPR